MTLHLVSLDAGNGWVKFGDGRVYKSFVHGLRSLRGYEWDSVVKSSGGQGARPEYIEVFESKRSRSSSAYATGIVSFEHGFTEYEVGARRYREGYYNVLALQSLSVMLRDKSFEKPDNDNEIVMACTHAPQDLHFADRLVSCIKGNWKIQSGGKTLYYNIVHVETVEEPVAGLLNYTLDKDGVAYPQKELWKQTGDVLVLDIGSYTSDFLSADQRGVPFPKGAKSETVGIDKAKRVFIDLMRSAHDDMFPNGDSISEDQVEAAFRNKRNGKHFMPAFGDEIDCTEQVEMATYPMLNQILSAYRNEYAGGSRYGTILLDGGGSGLMHEILRESLGHKNIHLVDVVKRIQFANARGAGKMLNMMQRNGYLKEYA